MPAKIIICRANPLKPDPRVEKEARALTDMGYLVSLLGWDMNGDQPQEEDIAGFKVYRLRVKASFGRGLGNVRHQLRWQIALLGWLARHQRSYDLIHACDFDTVLPALVCRLLWKKRVIYDIFDFYADMLRATPDGVRRLIRYFDIKSIGLVDAVILADDSRRTQINGSHPKRVAIIYNCLDDVKLRQPDSPQADPVEHGLRITYVGNIQVERGLLELLDVLRSHPNWKLDLAGFGGDETPIRQSAQQLSNVTWHGRIPYEQSLRLNAAADILIATYDPKIPNNRFASPNKVYEAMMLGKPIIVARGTNMDRIIEQKACGIVVKYGESTDLEIALQPGR
jgi:glycosyltransferase involved in cell wall biosynthesis